MDNSIIPLYAEVKGIVELTCSRCLQKFPYDIDLEIDEKFTDNPENKDDEVIFINNYEVDINEIVENNIILSLPIKKLCREDCKGLCPMCGTNLNISTCNCHEDNIDPRFAKLKDLFSNH
ncbi:YceD family protein [Clostridium acetobutylicum]